jgi:hypothetical protein
LHHNDIGVSPPTRRDWLPNVTRSYAECLNELKKEILPGNAIRYVVVPAVQSEELNKKPFSDEADLIFDGNGQQVGLSKALFAELVYEGVDDFGQLDMSGFAPIFKIIKDTMADTDGTEAAPTSPPSH